MARKRHWRNPFAGEGIACAGGLGAPPSREKVLATVGRNISSQIEDVVCDLCISTVEYLHYPVYRRGVQDWADEAIETFFGPGSVCLGHSIGHAGEAAMLAWQHWSSRNSISGEVPREAFKAGWDAIDFRLVKERWLAADPVQCGEGLEAFRVGWQRAFNWFNAGNDGGGVFGYTG